MPTASLTLTGRRVAFRVTAPRRALVAGPPITGEDSRSVGFDLGATLAANG
jgi:hypothetical protein